MTVLVLLVILYRAFFWFARGVEKNIRILTKKFTLNTLFHEGAPLPLAKNCTPLQTVIAPPYTVSIKIRVICHVSPHETQNPEEFVTEVCYPVRKKK